MKFTLGQVLTVTTGRLLCPMDELYAILNFMTQEDLYTHQLPRASNHCKPALLEKYPILAKLRIPYLDSKQEYDEFLMLASINLKLEDGLEVDPLDMVYPAMNPIDELNFMRGDQDVKVIGRY